VAALVRRAVNTKIQRSSAAARVSRVVRSKSQDVGRTQLTHSTCKYAEPAARSIGSRLPGGVRTSLRS
jgi:hypothetical protein